MVITSISGGPGNQLFQYAAGKYLADKLKSKLILDYSWYTSKASKAVAKREFVLDELLHNNAYDIAISGWVAKILRLNLMLANNIPFIKNYSYTRVNETKSFIFDSRFDRVAGNIFINGFWQAWKYSSILESNILSSNFIDDCLANIDVDILALIQKPNSICVSVRRGSDYGEDLLVCDEKYYSLAINNISEYLGKDSLSPSIFVFSDNIDWCKKNLSLESYSSVIFVEKFAGIDKWKTDLYLGSQCTHHVLSNSSFSWWVAALNRYENRKINKYVAVPMFWWNFIPVEEIDIYPQNWTVIKN